MSYAEILAFADDSEEGIARAEAALAIAKSELCSLDVDVVAPLSAFLTSSGPEGLASYYEEERARVRKEAEAAAERVRRSLGANGAAHEKVAVHARDMFFSDVRTYAAVSARATDLVIAGQPPGMDSVEAELLTGALFGGGKPCLMLPRWTRPHSWGRRVFIAWKGTPEAARAVAGALPFIRKAETVRICCANPRGAREGEDDQSLNRLATYLMRHGAKVEPVVTATSWEGAEKLIESEIEGFNADLVVMGAYGHSRLREMIFGGLTERMIKNANAAVLLAH